MFQHFQSYKHNMKKTNNRPVVHETPEVGQPGPSADEYVAVVTFAAKARGATIAVHKETQKDSSAMPQRTHAY
jgi:hypothetical protein